MTEGLGANRPAHIEAGLRGLVKSMVALAASDRIIDEREVRAIGTIFTDLTGQELDANEIREAAITFRNERLSIGDMLSGIQHQIDPDFKRTIVKACYLIAVADELLVKVELEDVRKVGGHLKLSPKTVDKLIVEMEKRLQAERPYH